MGNRSGGGEGKRPDEIRESRTTSYSHRARSGERSRVLVERSFCRHYRPVLKQACLEIQRAGHRALEAPAALIALARSIRPWHRNASKEMQRSRFSPEEPHHAL